MNHSSILNNMNISNSRWPCASYSTKLFTKL